MILENIPTGTEPSTVAVLAGLIIFLIISFKIMQMLAETVIVSIISAVFYIGTAVYLNMELSINRVLAFSFAGSTLYVAYKSLASAKNIISTVAIIPESLYKILKSAALTTWKLLKKITGSNKESQNNSEEKTNS